MDKKYEVTLKKYFEEMALEEIYIPAPLDTLVITSPEITRPGLFLAGYYDYFDEGRIQALGQREIMFLCELPPEVAEERVEKLCSLSPPLIVVTKSMDIPDVLLKAVQNHHIPLGRSTDNTTEFLAATTATLLVSLAPRITRHGVLMEVFGEGVLILGESGIGKSETAIELIVRGHRLIADDAVEIRRVSRKALVGSAPENIRHFMELRGVGVINVRRMYGMSSVKVTEKLSLIIQLQPWEDNKAYDRLGTENEYIEILGIKIPAVTIPVRPGRNLAVIIETATMNLRLKQMGYAPVQELMKALGMPEDTIPPVEKIIGNVNWDAR